MTRAKLIAFAGLDGAGKTTQAELTARWMRQRGASVTAVTSVGPSFTKRVLSDAAAELGLPDYMDLLGADMTRLVGMMVRYRDWTQTLLPALAVDEFVVVDRYLACFFASVRALGTNNEQLLRTILRALPEPDLTILLRVSPETAVARLRKRATDDERLEYLTAMDQAYATLPDYGDFVTVDGDAESWQVQERIQAAVGDWLRGEYALAGLGSRDDWQ
ncbi:dTMP kinase [Allorhizocola rhizosphaerae]|uniref:dTMP kinase n=1 Tax=Allorhizocola rhizosphaerae TaxID=1872709 RepID=UPI0013C2D852|nr:deoxynucleoside kinase [Allorhizocola rhizosphaerae]